MYNKEEVQRLADLIEARIRNKTWRPISLARYLCENNYRDVGEKILVDKKKYILANKCYSDSTLKSLKKDDLIEHIRILEHNWASAEEKVNNQANYLQDKVVLSKEEHTALINEFNALKHKYDDICDRYRLCKDENETIRQKCAELIKENNDLEAENNKLKEELRQASELKAETIKLVEMKTARKILKKLKDISTEEMTETLFDRYKFYRIGEGGFKSVAKECGVDDGNI